MVLAAGAVEPPVFGHAVVGINVALARVVLPARALRGHFQHELRRLADLANHVAVALKNGGGVYAERDQAIGLDPASAVVGVVAQIAFAPDEHVGPRAEVVVEDQVRPGRCRGLLHGIGSLGRIGQRRQARVPVGGGDLSVVVAVIGGLAAGGLGTVTAEGVPGGTL